MFVNKTNTLFVFKRSLRCDFCILNQFQSLNFNKNVYTCICINELFAMYLCFIETRTLSNNNVFVYVDHYACKWPGQNMIGH